MASTGQNGASRRAKSIGHYILGKTIGEGTFGKVKIGTHIMTGERVAVKVLEKERIVEVADVERVAREVHILKLIRHPHIIQLYEIIETRRQLYLIMEYASGGELFDYIVANGRVQEPEACRFFHQIIAGVEKIHATNVVHRDLKPENLMLDDNHNIKIVDFGLSNVFRDGQLLKTACGSPCYAAPEMIAGHSYVPSLCDLWSCGVILFALVCGYLPFEDQNTATLYKKILAADYKPPKFISSAVKGLITGLLTTDPTRRVTIPIVREHEWYRLIPEASVRPRDLLILQGGVDEEDIFRELDAFGFPRDYAIRCLELNKHNQVTTTYYLLAAKKRRMMDRLEQMIPNQDAQWGYNVDVSMRSRVEPNQPPDMAQREAPDQHRTPSATPGDESARNPESSDSQTVCEGRMTSSFDVHSANTSMEIVPGPMRYQQQVSPGRMRSGDDSGHAHHQAQNPPSPSALPPSNQKPADTPRKIAPGTPPAAGSSVSMVPGHGASPERQGVPQYSQTAPIGSNEATSGAPTSPLAQSPRPGGVGTTGAKLVQSTTRSRASMTSRPIGRESPVVAGDSSPSKVPASRTTTGSGSSHTRTSHHSVTRHPTTPREVAKPPDSARRRDVATGPQGASASINRGSSQVTPRRAVEVPERGSSQITPPRRGIEVPERGSTQVTPRRGMEVVDRTSTQVTPRRGMEAPQSARARINPRSQPSAAPTTSPRTNQSAPSSARSDRPAASRAMTVSPPATSAPRHEAGPQRESSARSANAPSTPTPLGSATTATAPPGAAATGPSQAGTARTAWGAWMPGTGASRVMRLTPGRQ